MTVSNGGSVTLALHGLTYTFPERALLHSSEPSVVYLAV